MNYNYGDAEVAMMFWFLMGSRAMSTDITQIHRSCVICGTLVDYRGSSPSTRRLFCTENTPGLGSLRCKPGFDRHCRNHTFQRHVSAVDDDVQRRIHTLQIAIESAHPRDRAISRRANVVVKSTIAVTP